MRSWGLILKVCILLWLFLISFLEKHKKDSHSLGTLLSNMASIPNQLEFIAILQSVLATTQFVNTSNTSNMSNMHLNLPKTQRKK